MPGSRHFFRIVLLFVVTAAGTRGVATAQDTKFEVWPELDVWKTIEPNLNLLFIEAITRSREIKYTDVQSWANIDYRWFPQEIYPLALSFRAGYLYASEITDSPEPYKEHRAVADITPRYNLANDVILFDRNRVEFRWVNSDYSTRYRNRLRLEYRPTVEEKLITAYFSFEMVDDYTLHKWSRNYIQVGLEVPLAWFVSLEVSFCRQNSSGSSAPAHVNALGTVVAFFF